MKRKALEVVLAAALVAALATLAAGCGGGSDSSASSEPSTKPGRPLQTGISQFLNDKNAGKFITFGVEASPREREAASKVLEKNLEAREEADFSAQCATLDLATAEEVAEPKKGNAAVAACPKALKKAAEPLSSSIKIRADTLDGPIAALRVMGSSAYALYHGSDKKDYAMPLTKEAGKWKVGSLVTVEIG